MAGLLDFIQGASNSAAGTISGPVDLINMGLLGIGMPMPNNPFGGSQWMRERGLIRDPQNRAMGLLGEAAGNVLPIVAAAKAPQIANGLLQMGENARAPTPMNTATRGQAGAIVYHGSPHKFDKFDSSKIGTGEGAQAYGHGLYFAESPGTATFYKNMDHPALGKDPRDAITAIRQNWQTNTNPRHLSEKEVRYLMKDYPELASHLDNPDVVKNVARVVNGQEVGGTVSSEAIYAMRALDKMLPPKPTGALYKVDIPDEHIAKMLDWDKPLSQQAPEVRAIAAKRLEEIRAMGGKFPADPSGEYLHRAFNPQAGEQGFGQAIAAQKLRDAGIPGIRYLDGGSRGAGTGTSNYVVFPGNEGLLSILGRE